ncbi:MAG TPA: LacI family DNA-binding transcriptional regulator, partial [Actinomycetota bacterium]|nr:LacI family DNA-binding transcriptional regulator [Actinomycetota bacterium]
AMPVTIYDVARQAGVSIATVSRVLRRSAPVQDETRQRVEDAVDALGFVPSRLGVSLAERRHAANGVVFPDLSGPYFAEVVLGYEEVTSRLGRSVLILSTREQADAEATVRELASRVDGLAVFDGTVGEDTVHASVAGGLPVVRLARRDVDGADAVAAENLASAERLTEHLLGHGHRRLAFLGDPGHSSDVAERYAGVCAVLERHGLTPAEPVRCASSEASAKAAATALLESPDRPDAIVCGNDERALATLLAAEDLGLRVPGDVAVTGWDDILAARHARPALTTVRQPMRELGAWAARALDERIRGDRDTPATHLLPTRLIVRSSCGHHQKEER